MRYHNGGAVAAGEALEQRRMVRNNPVAAPTQYPVPTQLECDQVSTVNSISCESEYSSLSWLTIMGCSEKVNWDIYDFIYLLISNVKRILFTDTWRWLLISTGSYCKMRSGSNIIHSLSNRKLLYSFLLLAQSQNWYRYCVILYAFSNFSPNKDLCIHIFMRQLTCRNTSKL